MKKVLLFLFMSINFLSADVNECMNDVYFANGIDTSEEDAERSKDRIKSEFKASNPEAYRKVENWEVAYNHTHGIGADLYESMLQKMYHMTEIENRGTKGYLMLLLNLDSASGLFEYTFKGITKKIASKAPEELVKTYAGKAAKQLAKKSLHAYNKKWGKRLSEEELELIFNEVFDYLIDQSVSSYIDKTRAEIEKEEFEDIKKHFTAYTTSIKDGHGVITLAHSQGNLFTNIVHYNFELNGKGWMKDYFSALGVASPANNILGEKSPYITFDNDMIQLVPDSLPTNVTNPKRYFVKNALGEVIGETQFSVEAHSFLTSYMTTATTKKTILDFIKEKIDVHKTRASQWVKDQEFDKDTKDYKITVKHTKDPNNIIISDKIYPFNLNGKIYPLYREYVKASCGGKSITETDEYWAIDNPEEEKIEGKENEEGSFPLKVAYLYVDTPSSENINMHATVFSDTITIVEDFTKKVSYSHCIHPNGWNNECVDTGEVYGYKWSYSSAQGLSDLSLNALIDLSEYGGTAYFKTGLLNMDWNKYAELFSAEFPRAFLRYIDPAMYNSSYVLKEKLAQNNKTLYDIIRIEKIVSKMLPMEEFYSNLNKVSRYYGANTEYKVFYK